MLLGLSFAKAQIQPGVYRIINEKTGKALTYNTKAPSNRTLYQTTVNNNEEGQKWRLTGTASLMLITVATDPIPNQENDVWYLFYERGALQIRKRSNVAAESNCNQWAFLRQSNGNYCIQNGCSERIAIDVPRGKSDEGLGLIPFKPNGDDNQRFQLVKVN